MAVYSSVSSTVGARQSGVAGRAARRQPPVPQRRAQRLPPFVTGGLRSCSDVFTGGTPVKEIEVFADPLVSNLTTPVISPPLDVSNMP
jgi:hypothetical protein